MENNAPTTTNKLLQAGVIVLALAAIAYSVLSSEKCFNGNCSPGSCGNAKEGGAGAPINQSAYPDLSEYKKVDPALVTYSEVGRIKTGLANARGIAIGPGDAAYAVGDGLVIAFDAGGTAKSRTAIAGAAECAAVAEDGNIYVGMKDHVEVYEEGGGRIAKWPSLGERAFITCVSVADNDVFVADAGNQVIARYDKSGSVVTRIGKQDDKRDVPGLRVPSHHLDVAIGHDDLIVVNNPGRQKIEMYTYDGDIKESWGEHSAKLHGFPGCCNPTDIAVLQDGSILTGDKGLLRVRVFDSIGTLLGFVAVPADFAAIERKIKADAFAGLDLAVDSRGRILMLEPTAGEIVIFERKQAGR